MGAHSIGSLEVGAYSIGSQRPCHNMGTQGERGKWGLGGCGAGIGASCGTEELSGRFLM